MPEFIATYDLKETSPHPHGPFKKIASELKWTSFVIDSRHVAIRVLPNTTLSITASTMREAVASFAQVVAKVKAQVSNFHIENVTIVGNGEVCAFHDGEAIRY